MQTSLVQKCKQIGTRVRQSKSKIKIMLPIIFIVLASLNVVDDVVDFVVRDSIKDMSMAFLKDSEKHAQETFTLLSAGKAAMAVVESSSAGVSFIIDVNVQLGKALTPLRELFDYAWQFTLSSLSLILLSQIVFDVLDYLIEPYIIYLGLVWIAYELTKRFIPNSKWRVKALLTHSGLIFLLLFITYPMAIAGSAAVSKTITSKYSKDIHTTLNQHNALFNKVPKPGSSKDVKLKDNAESAIGMYKENLGKIDNHVSKMHKTLYTHIAVGITEIIVMPLLIILIFHFGLRNLLYPNKKTNNL